MVSSSLKLPLESSSPSITPILARDESGVSDSLCLSPRLSHTHTHTHTHTHSPRVCGQVKAHPELQTLAEEGGGIFGEEEEYHLGTFFRRAMNLVPDSYLENMLWAQVTLHGLADSLDSIYDLISWKDRASTAFITLGIFVSMFLFLVVPFNIFLMIQGTWYDILTSTYLLSTTRVPLIPSIDHP